MDEAQARSRLRYLQLKAKAIQKPSLGPKPPEPNGVVTAFGSGAVRMIPQAIDLAGATVATTLDNTIGKGGDYFEGFMQPRQTPADDIVTAVFGPEYEAQGVKENVAKLVGGILGPQAALKVAKNAASFVNTLRKAPKEFITDPKKLQEIYTAWDRGLESIGLSKGMMQKEVVDPFVKEVAHRLPTMGKADREIVEQVKGLSKAPPNARSVEGLRKNLSGQGGSVAQTARESTDRFMLSNSIPAEGRDAYRRLATVKSIDDATENFGAETVAATRRKVAKVDVKTPEEIAAKRAATRSGLVEGGLRTAGRLGNALMSGATTVASGSPATGVAMYATGRGLEGIANRMSGKKFENLRNVVMNNRAAPDFGERAGLLVRALYENPRSIVDMPSRAKDALIKALQGK